MKHIPILFSTPMVQAILEGRKTQTRRVVKPQPETVNIETPIPMTEYLDKLKGMEKKGLKTVISGTGGHTFPNCPYGQPGDVLWVRETWQLFSPYGPEDYYFGYKASPGEIGIEASEKYDYAFPDIWKPSIHMPKEACRLLLRVKSVRVERLQEITRGDAMDEGCPFANMADGPNPKDWFNNLWQSINGPESWDANPWVWVVEFKRITKEEAGI